MSTKTTRGFTLVELIISIGLFALVMMVAMGAYFTLISLDRQARATNQLVNNLSFAMDTMVRGIRTGTNYQCTDSVTGAPDADGNSTNGGCTAFTYHDTGLGIDITYSLLGGKIVRCENTSICTAANASPLTDSTITLNTLAFRVRGAGKGLGNDADQQAQVLFVIKGTMSSGSGGKTVPFTIQESATQRIIEL